MVRAVSRRKIVRAGRRWGKTVGAATLAVEAFGWFGKRVLYATPTADQIKKFWFEVKFACADLIDAGILYKNETEHIIEVPGTETRIRAKTAWNADTLRGDHADLLILDEWQLMDESAWEDVGAPMLIDNGGDAVFIYTPPSLRSRSVSKATDPLHAAKMFKAATAEMKAAEKEGRESRWLAIHGKSHDNPNLSPEGLAEVMKDMSQLSLRQEIFAEDVEEVPGALWKLKLIDSLRVSEAPELKRIVVGVDPSGGTVTEVGIVAAGVGANGHAYIICDDSLAAPSPDVWAKQVVSTYLIRRADRVLGERNYGGDMVQSTIRGARDANDKKIGESISYKDVNASRGKYVRAEPIAAAYERGQVHHVGTFPALEEEMCSFVPGGKSPNRMDALVWALTELILDSDELAVLNLLASGQAQQLLDKPRQLQPATAPVAAAEVVGCPSCGSTLTSKIAGGQSRCGQCAHQWGQPAIANTGFNRSNVEGVRR